MRKKIQWGGRKILGIPCHVREMESHPERPGLNQAVEATGSSMSMSIKSLSKLPHHFFSVVLVSEHQAAP